MAESGDASDLPADLALLGSDIQHKLSFHKDAFNGYIVMNNSLHKVIEERVKLQQEHNVFHQLVASKEELTKINADQEAEIELLKRKLGSIESRNIQEAEGYQLIASKEEELTKRIADQEEEIKLLKRNLEVSKSKNIQVSLGNGSQANQNQSERVQTRAMQKRKRQFQGHAGEEADELELVEDLFGINNLQQGSNALLENLRTMVVNIHSKMIKGFVEIDKGGRNIGIKHMGHLSSEPFQLVCGEKFPPEEAKAKASELHYFWQGQLMNPDWNPFKIVTVGGIQEEIINVDDDKLQELQTTWGECVYEAVVNGLMEMKECGSLRNRTIYPEVWNYKEKRRASLSECVEYVWAEVKRLRDEKGRMNRRKREGYGGGKGRKTR